MLNSMVKPLANPRTNPVTRHVLVAWLSACPDSQLLTLFCVVCFELLCLILLSQLYRSFAVIQNATLETFFYQTKKKFVVFF